MSYDPSAVPAGSVSDRPSATRSPSAALAELLAGNRRFAAGRPRYGHHVAAAAAASGDQHPFAVVVGCIDSRVPLEAVFDQDFGAICAVRSGGHVLDRAVLGSVELAVTELRAPLVMVLGHERCGAVAVTIAAARAGRPPAGQVGYLVDAIAPAVSGAGPADPPLGAVVRAHVRRTVAVLRRLDLLATVVGSGAVAVVGAVYDLDTGTVDLLS